MTFLRIITILKILAEKNWNTYVSQLPSHRLLSTIIIHLNGMSKLTYDGKPKVGVTTRQFVRKLACKCCASLRNGRHALDPASIPYQTQ